MRYGPYDRYETKTVDVGHSDRCLVVESDELNKERKTLLKQRDQALKERDEAMKLVCAIDLTGDDRAIAEKLGWDYLYKGKK
jgi:hypothetical protein